MPNSTQIFVVDWKSTHCIFHYRNDGYREIVVFDIDSTRRLENYNDWLVKARIRLSNATFLSITKLKRVKWMDVDEYKAFSSMW